MSDKSVEEFIPISEQRPDQITYNRESLVSERWKQELAESNCAEYIKPLSDNDELFPDDIGADITDEDGRVICTAEYIWNKNGKVALLANIDKDKKLLCETRGYDVYIIGKDSPEQLLAALKKEMLNT